VQANYTAFNCDHCNCNDEHDAGFPKWHIPEIDLTSSKCLRWMVTPRSVQILRLHAQYDANILPFAGGWLDQPNLFAVAMELINSHKARSEREKKR